MTHENLIKKLKSKDPSALSHLYDNYAPALLGVVKRIVKNHSTAEDILQESFIKIWRNIDQYDEAKGRLYTWMHRITRNTTLNYINLKSEKIKSAERIENENSDIYGIQKPNIDVIDLKGKVNTLDRIYYEVIELIYFKGYTQKDASEKLGIPLGTVKTRCRIAIRELKKIYEYTPVIAMGLASTFSLMLLMLLWIK